MPDPLDLAASLVASIHDYAVYMLDVQGRVMTWNPGAERITGYAADEIVGRPATLLYPDPEAAAERVRIEFERAAHEGRFEDEAWRVRKDGTPFWASVVLTPVRATDGRLAGYARVVRDLTERRRSDVALRQSEERLRLLLDNIRDYAIFMLDLDGRVRTWNPGARRLKGYEADEILGQSISCFYLPEDDRAGKPQRLLARAAQVGRVEDVGWRVRKDGTRFWADVVISAIRDDHGALRGYVKVTRDLTELHVATEALRSSEDRHRILIDAVSDYAIFMLDPGGRVTTWNPGAQRIHGYTQVEVLGQPLDLFYPPEERTAGRAERELRIALTEGRFEEEAWRIRKDGTRFWANVILSPIVDEAGVHRGFAKVTRDLTERRALDEERLRLARAREALRLRDEFIALASHELRTPLTSLHLQLQALARRRDDLQPWLEARLGRASRSADRLSALIDGLLDVAKISTGHLEMNPEDLDLGALIADVLQDLQVTAERAGCTLTFTVEDARGGPPGPVVGRWDRLRIEQVVTNLVSNALRYASGGPVEVTLRREGRFALVKVRDRGPGFDEDTIPRLFERFERASPIAHHGGLGLGLYLSREIARAHGGEIHAHNDPGGGAVLLVRLPLDGGPAAAAKAPPAGTEPAA